ncbi:hypothetical protein TCEA9_19630 [Thermobrachium celere]|nr:hypothetical protein TCEA9_19630 [Thermobrachium celere]
MMSMIKIDYNNLINKFKGKDTFEYIGKVKKVIGLTIEVEGIDAFIGELCKIKLLTGKQIDAEVVGFTDDGVLLMPLGDITGISTGSLVYPTGNQLTVPVGKNLLGKILDGLGRPLDNSKINFEAEYKLDNDPPNPLLRKRIDTILPTGVKAIDGFLTCGRGQRIGIFAGSGVGKSTLLGMIAKYSDADVNVIGLIGERGREVKEFIEKDLGPEGLKKICYSCCNFRSTSSSKIKGCFYSNCNSRVL